MSGEVNSVMTLEISFLKRVTICSDMKLINTDSLQSIQKTFIPQYVESLDFDVSKYIVMSKVVEVTDKNDKTITPKKNELWWNIKRLDGKNSLIIE
jgi:hypothetical protein